MGLNHTAARLSRETEIALFSYTYLPTLPRFSRGGETKHFQSLRTTWPRCDKGPLRMFDSYTDTFVMQTLSSIPLVSELRRFDCNTETSIMWTLGSVLLLSVLRRFDCRHHCNADTWLCPFGICVEKVWLYYRHLCNVDTWPCPFGIWINVIWL